MRHLMTLGLLLGLTLLVGQASAAPEGHYRGELAGQPLAADLQLLDTTLIGILVVGEARYLVNVSRQGDSFLGHANDMSSGQESPLRIQGASQTIQVQLDSQQFTLHHQR